MSRKKLINQLKDKNPSLNKSEIEVILDLFSEGISTTSGEEVSSIEVRKSLELLIEEENKKKPYTDDQLAHLLRDKGYKLARRTVAKYREGIGAPVARLRKQL